MDAASDLVMAPAIVAIAAACMIYVAIWIINCEPHAARDDEPDWDV